ncbi:hypothetical protein HanXRQr2_Chr04g0167281 [Helianthus annuus]|uniref:Uncharacterized protein n=1 Tax=Helianthus annuus TaxID=4232 RepID=A0A9K3J876_HELAN|nr:hypothetical protein HanXRQr2_Chr04g0167281 [Helianthus annuus]
MFFVGVEFSPEAFDISVEFSNRRFNIFNAFVQTCNKVFGHISILSATFTSFIPSTVLVSGSIGCWFS